MYTCVGAFRGRRWWRWRCVDNQDYVGGYTRSPAPPAWLCPVPLLLLLLCRPSLSSSFLSPSSFGLLYRSSFASIGLFRFAVVRSMFCTVLRCLHYLQFPRHAMQVRASVARFRATLDHSPSRPLLRLTRILTHRIRADAVLPRPPRKAECAELYVHSGEGNVRLERYNIRRLGND